MGRRSDRRRVAALVMKIRDDDPFFTVNVPFLRIRSSTPAEAAARTARWNRSRTGKVRRRLEAAAKAERRALRRTITSAAGRNVVPEPLPPWREVAAVWRHVRATFDGLFLSEEEEEQARVAFHQGGLRWRVFLVALNERKRDGASLTGRGR